jgi:hypothetical protein
MLSGRHGDINGVTAALNNLKATAPNRMSEDMLRQLTDSELMHLVTQAVIARDTSIPQGSTRSSTMASLSAQSVMRENSSSMLTSQYAAMDDRQALVVSAAGSIGTFDEEVSKLDEQDELELDRRSWAALFGDAQTQAAQNEAAGGEEERLMLDTDDAIETISSATSEDDIEEEPRSLVADPSLVSIEMPLVRRDRKRVDNLDRGGTLGEPSKDMVAVGGNMMNIGMIGVPTATKQISELKQKLKESNRTSDMLRYVSLALRLP